MTLSEARKQTEAKIANTIQNLNNASAQCGLPNSTPSTQKYFAENIVNLHRVLKGFEDTLYVLNGISEGEL